MGTQTNCWKFKACGREPGGANVKEMGVCPAAVAKEYTGANGGTNAGRMCWAVAGTFCGGKVQGSFAEKKTTCLSCEFMKAVKQEEGAAFQLAATARV